MRNTTMTRWTVGLLAALALATVAPGGPVGARGGGDRTVTGTTMAAPVDALAWAPRPAPIGELRLDGQATADADLRHFAGLPSAVAGGGTAVGPSGMDHVVAPSVGCQIQCITEGIAYPRGFGAQIEVRTDTPAQYYAEVVAVDAVGQVSFTEVTTESFLSETFSWSLDHLQPGTTYQVLVGAYDGVHWSHATGSLTTLSSRQVFVAIDGVTVAGGPTGVTSTGLHLGFDGGELVDYTPGVVGLNFYHPSDRAIDLELWVTRRWSGDLCQAWSVTDTTPWFGWHDASCLAWASARRADVDLDVPPPGPTHWTSKSFGVTLPTEGLPAGLSFTFTASLTISVSYS